MNEFDWDKLGDMLEREGDVFLPVAEQAAAWLRDQAGEVRRILDVGSGPGVATCVFAAAFPGARVVAADGAEQLLARATARAEKRGVDIQTLRADLPEQFGELGAADLIWTSQAMHHLGDQQAALTELGKLLRPGGLLAVAEGGLPARYLPRDLGFGRPGLLSRILSATEDWFTEMRAEIPGSSDTVEDWPAMLANAGLEPVGTRSFLLDLPAPLDAETRQHLIHGLTRTRGRLTDRFDAEDLATVDQLLDPENPAGLLLRRDVFLLAARTVYVGRAGR